MINYYKELGLNPSSSLEEINQELTKQESLWTRRQVTNPEKSTQKLSLIMQARKVFSSPTSRMEYDRSLERSKEKPKRVDPQADRNQQFQKWRDQTRTYLETNQYDLAKSSAEKALSFYDSNNDDDQFLSLVAEVYFKNGNQQFALDYINKAIILNSNNPYYYIIKSTIQRELATKSYNYQEADKYLQDARNTLLMAIKVSQNINDKKMESAACGLLAYYYYFVPSPNRARAEEYANKSIALGDVYGNASRVIDDLNKTREKERIAADEERRKQQEAKIRQEQEEKRQKELQEQQKKREEQRLQANKQKKIIRILYTLSWVAFIIYTLIILYFLFFGQPKNTLVSDISWNLDLTIFTYLLIIGLWSFFGRASDHSVIVPLITSLTLYGGLAGGAGTIIIERYLRRGIMDGIISSSMIKLLGISDYFVIKFIGISMAVCAIIVLVFGFFGGRIKKRIENKVNNSL